MAYLQWYHWLYDWPIHSKLNKVSYAEERHVATKRSGLKLCCRALVATLKAIKVLENLCRSHIHRWSYGQRVMSRMRIALFKFINNVLPSWTRGIVCSTQSKLAAPETATVMKATWSYGLYAILAIAFVLYLFRRLPTIIASLSEQGPLKSREVGMQECPPMHMRPVLNTRKLYIAMFFIIYMRR